MASIVFWRLMKTFHLSALVCLRQCIRNVATLLYLTVPSRNQLSNVPISFSQSGTSSAPASPLQALPMRFSSPAAFCTRRAAKRTSELPNRFPNKRGEAPIPVMPINIEQLCGIAALVLIVC